MIAGLTALFQFLAGLVRLGNKQAAANAAAVQTQAGVDREQAASLAAQNKALAAQNAAVVSAPKTIEDVQAEMRKGSY
jgi:hypothetical protein